MADEVPLLLKREDRQRYRESQELVCSFGDGPNKNTGCRGVYLLKTLIHRKENKISSPHTQIYKFRTDFSQGANMNMPTPQYRLRPKLLVKHSPIERGLLGKGKLKGSIFLSCHDAGRNVGDGGDNCNVQWLTQ